MDALNPIPNGFHTNDVDGVLVITRRWYEPRTWFYLVFTLVWNGFMYNWYSIVLSSDSPNMFALLFPVIHVGLGLWLIYKTITSFANRTVLRIGNGKVIVRHGPFPWPGNKEVETQSIKQLFCDEKGSWTRNPQMISYRVNAVMKNDRKEVLVAGGLERDQALYLELVAEKKLGIQPVPVVGELSE